VPPDDENWLDDYQDIYGSARDILEELIAEQGMPSLNDLDRYDVYMSGDEVEMKFTFNDGSEYTSTMEGIDLESETWWDVWDIWDWIEDTWDDVDLDSHYTD